ncbi:hypothetical protein PB01_14050 [Psychrobacillus glaciei]|uniref:Uncharacterized protein n=1 Tax=Psychrobacillus glaciei TaxID=2283160 RepID=A0A5J6SUB1_9BACI|nr:hypothetical protein [Psychrobacillus glaciei]QFF99857.1 hypothetical protein PB01_14050 [Psychrobacillus glaciei]
MSTEKTENLKLNICEPTERLFLDEWNENFETIDGDVEKTKTQLEETVKKVNGVSHNVNGNVNVSGGTGDFSLMPNLYIANPANPLDIETYDGSNQPTHPSVKFFENKWNGFHYWMAYTPYPNNNSDLENPCVVASNDGTNWVTPSGLINPLDVGSKYGQGAYLSDTHLVYRPDTNTLECWYRGIYGSPVVEHLFRRTTNDGINWTSVESMYSIQSANSASLISPVVLWDNSVKKYLIWIIFSVSQTNRYLKYYESTDGKAWTFIRDIRIDDPSGRYIMWHFDIIKSSVGYEFVGSYQDGGQFDKINYLCYAKSSDNITYSKPDTILGSGYKGSFDDLELYRPCLVRMSNYIMLYYGAQKDRAIWHIGLIKAPNINVLVNLLADKDIQESKTSLLLKLNDLETRTFALEQAVLNIPDLPSSVQTTVLSDTFDRVNGGLGVADTGQAWVVNNTFDIVGGKAKAGSGDGNNYATTNAGASNFTAEITITCGTSGSGTFTFRGLDALSPSWRDCFAVVMAKDANKIELMRHMDTVIGNHNITLLTGQEYLIKVVCGGASIKVYLDDVEILNAIDSAYFSQTQVGMYQWGANGTFLFDDLSVKA